MSTKTRLKKYTENMETNIGERDIEEKDQEKRQINISKTRQQQDLSPGTYSLFNLSGKIQFLSVSFNR
jgi:hypothetical protein